MVIADYIGVSPPIPVRELSRPEERFNGVPECRIIIPPNCHPAMIVLAIGWKSLDPKGLQISDVTELLVTSKSSGL